MHSSICTGRRGFLSYVPGGVGDEGVGHAARYHRGANIDAIRPADRVRFSFLLQANGHASDRFTID